MAIDSFSKIRSLYQGGLLILDCSIGTPGISHFSSGNIPLAITGAIACAAGFPLAFWLIRRAFVTEGSSEVGRDTLYAETAALLRATRDRDLSANNPADRPPKRENDSIFIE
jgi:hypothetical protein